MSARRITMAATGVAALLAGSFTMSQANAQTPTFTPDVLSSQAAVELATTLDDTLSAETAGTFYDAETETLVVNVTDSSAVSEVRATGAEARVVEHTLAQLEAAADEVEEYAVPGTAWGIDPVSNAVKVTVDSTVSGDALAELQATVDGLGGQAVLEQVEGEFSPYIAGGDAIYTSGARCSLGFNVTIGGQRGFLTAGHCGSTGSSWSATSGGAAFGTLSTSVFPGSDYAAGTYSSSIASPSSVNLYNGSTRAITGAANPVVGQTVERSGSTTGRHSGTVTALNVSVTYPQGTVRGTIQTTVCAEPGDSGGALFSGNTAHGLTSGGSGNCSSGGTTFFQPVVAALNAVGATIP
ncbi:S1 family peptidase [Streptomyces carpaticus]|nr:S1 family peptidase [Streptomyces carpaticus]